MAHEVDQVAGLADDLPAARADAALTAAVTLVDGQHRVTATMHFDAEGRVTTFDGRRNRTVPGGYELETWSTPITRYGEFGGLRLPSAGQGVWHLATGDLPYVEIEVLEVEQDRPEPY